MAASLRQTTPAHSTLATRMATLMERAGNVRLAPPEEEQGAADQQHANGGGRCDASDAGHGFDPPQDVEVPLLWCQFDALERRIDGALRRTGRAGFDPRPGGAIKRGGRRSCEPSSLDYWLRVDGEGVAELGNRVMESRSAVPAGISRRSATSTRGSRIVVQHENRALLDRESAEGPLQFVAVGDGVGFVRGRGPVGRQDPDVRRPVARPLRSS